MLRTRVALVCFAALGLLTLAFVVLAVTTDASIVRDASGQPMYAPQQGFGDADEKPRPMRDETAQYNYGLLALVSGLTALVALIFVFERQTAMLLAGVEAFALVVTVVFWKGLTL